jgi:fluoroacetyl-CoA thioesterase
VKGSLRPGLAARLEYVVPAERTVPHPLPESDEFAALPAVLATGFLVGSPLTVQAELANVDDRQLRLTVHAVDDAATVCQPARSEPFTVGRELIQTGLTGTRSCCCC